MSTNYTPAILPTRGRALIYNGLGFYRAGFSLMQNVAITGKTAGNRSQHVASTTMMNRVRRKPFETHVEARIEGCQACSPAVLTIQTSAAENEKEF
ncbi:hypothetical protein [Paraburkholderia flagellata]|uniref:hypothetical protein n=1 Tax=Paraburkholderia flagellata TaxID=2883241 RepID=UPI001F2E5E67|nr:hypothetical protein [Paraburkholderia flagellata]